MPTDSLSLQKSSAGLCHAVCEAHTHATLGCRHAAKLKMHGYAHVTSAATIISAIQPASKHCLCLCCTAAGQVALVLQPLIVQVSAQGALHPFTMSATSAGACIRVPVLSRVKSCTVHTINTVKCCTQGVCFILCDVCCCPLLLPT